MDNDQNDQQKKKQGVLYQAGQQVQSEALEQAKTAVKKRVAKTAAAKAVKKKAVETGAKIAAKTGVKIATTEVVSDVVATIGAAAGPLAPIVIPIIKFLAWLAVEILTSIPAYIQKLWKKNKEVFAAALMTGLGIGLANPFLTAGGLVLGAIALFPLILAPFLTTLAVTTAISTASLVILVGLIVLIINNSSYIVPYQDPGTPYNPPGGLFDVRKVAQGTDPSGNTKEGSFIDFPNEVLDPTMNITYTLTIIATGGEMTNITYQYSCNAISEAGNSNCANLHEVPIVPSTLNANETWTGTFTATYDRNFEDTAITDVFSVTAVVSGVSSTETASATVIFGNPPTECPSIWPTNTGYITQGAYTPIYSHRTVEAIDIGVGEGTTVVATHGGTVIAPNSDPDYGNNIVIQSICDGREFISLYGHLSGVSVSPGTTVTLGTPIGLSGNTGNSTGPHLHYEFKYTNGTNPSYPNNPPFMWSPYIPKNVPRGCIDVPTCNTSIP